MSLPPVIPSEVEGSNNGGVNKTKCYTYSMKHKSSMLDITKAIPIRLTSFAQGDFPHRYKLRCYTYSMDLLSVIPSEVEGSNNSEAN